MDGGMEVDECGENDPAPLQLAHKVDQLRGANEQYGQRPERDGDPHLREDEVTSGEWTNDVKDG